MIKIAGRQKLLSIAKDAAKIRQCGVTQNLIDFDHIRVPACLHSQIQSRHIECRHPQCLRAKAPHHVRQQTLNTPCQLRIHRNNRLGSRPRFTQVRVVVGVKYGLVVHRRMNGSDGAVLNADGIVEGLDQR